MEKIRENSERSVKRATAYIKRNIGTIIGSDSADNHSIHLNTEVS